MMRKPEHHAGYNENVCSLINSSAMDLDGPYTNESDSSPDTVNSPIINPRSFYSQKQKSTSSYVNIFQRTDSRKEAVHQQSNYRTVDDNSKIFHHSKKCKSKERRKLKACLKRKQRTPKIQSKQMVKKIRAVAGLKVGKLLSDRLNLKSESRPKINSSCYPSLSPKNEASHSAGIIVNNFDSMSGDFDESVHCNGKGNGEEVHRWKKCNSDDEDLWDEKNESAIIESSNYDITDTDSEDEDVLLRYSSTANEVTYSLPNNEGRDVEGSDFHNGSWKNSFSESKDISNGSLPDENSEQNSSVLCKEDSDEEIFDTSMCSFMDKQNNILSMFDPAMDDKNKRQLVVETANDDSFGNAEITSDQNLEKLQDNSAGYMVSKNREACRDHCSTLKNTDIQNNNEFHHIRSESLVNKGQSCSQLSHGLFKYFKKTTKEGEGLPSLEERKGKNSQGNICQKEQDRSSVKDSKRSPKHKKMFEYREDATIEKLSPLPGILPQSKLVSPSSKPCGISHTKRTKKATSSPMDGNKKFEQLYIDAGQKNFGHTTCPTCGMVYTKTLPEDVIQHSKYHHGVMQKLKFKGWKSERILTEYVDGRVIQVNPEDNLLHLKKVSELREVVDKELGFVYAVMEYPIVEKVFLFISNKKVLGCAIAVPVKEAYPVVTPQDVPYSEDRTGPTLSWCCSSKPVPALCGISRIWVLKQARRQQIASRLVDHVRRHFIYGVEIGKNELAFSDPTPDGRLFAEKYSETPNFLVFR